MIQIIKTTLVVLLLSSCLGKKGGGEMRTGSGGQGLAGGVNQPESIIDLANEINQSNGGNTNNSGSSSGGTATPTPTPTATGTSTNSNEGSITPTPTPSSTPTPSPTPTSSGTGNINTAIEIMNEEVNGFTYNPLYLGFFDYISTASIALNYRDMNNSQIAVVVSQAKQLNQWSPLRINKTNLDLNQVSNYSLNLNEKFHILRRSIESDQDYFLISAYPTKLFKINIENPTPHLIGEIAATSAIQPTKRIVGFIHQNKNRICGTLTTSQKYFFYKDENDSLKEFNYDESEKPKYVFCLKDQSLLIQTINDNIITLNHNGQTFLGGKTPNSCTKIALTFRGEELYYLCYYYNSANQLVYNSHAVASDGSSITQGPLPAATPVQALTYQVKIDNYSSADQNNNSILYYKKNNVSQWTSLPLNTISAPKNISSMKLSEGYLILQTQFAMLRYKNATIEKYPLMLTPKEIFDFGPNFLIYNSNNQAVKIDPTKATNNFQHSLIGNVPVEALNPTPFLNAEAKLTNIKNSVAGEESYRSYKDASGNYWLLNNNLIDIGQSHLIGLNKNIIIDIKSNSEFLFVVTKDLAGKFWISKYSKNLDFIQSQQISSLAPSTSKISIMNDYIFLSSTKDFQILNLDLSVIKKITTAGFTSRSFAAMNNDFALGVLNSKLVKIKISSGEITEIHNLAGTFTASPIELVLDIKTLYFNMGQSKILKLELPTSVFY